MPNSNFVFIIIAIIIAHFVFGVGYLIYKIMTAPKNQEQKNEQEE